MPCLKSAQIFTKMMKTHFFTELDFMNNQITISNLRLVPGILFNLLNADKKIDTAHSKNSIKNIDLALKIGDFSVFTYKNGHTLPTITKNIMTFFPIVKQFQKLSISRSNSKTEYFLYT